MKLRLALALGLFALTVHGFVTAADTDRGSDAETDRAQLEQLLRRFLAGTEQKTVHDSFWADELIYTSSRGTRYGKDQILSGFDDASTQERMRLEYGAEDVTIRVLGDTAVITFKLTADKNGVRDSEYLNTGVFQREGDGWRAFTWQATRIP